ncbi:cation diffusion facilitator family transporter [Intestinibacillus sp. Marseille-P6563]|uniref:cation diffusion facilitator family transporter n=1 Tax=Intestinibacillus sp. Marseille-P6563 TaxID=2364792 RepID=UPI000F057480|nr:cation diffusion facilitator family transporter [Intestinibacillus sp. Marseille-P6563]
MTQFIIRHFIPDADNVRDAQVRERYGVVSGIVGIFCNVFLFAIKLVIGLITGSISIAADAVNNLSDGLSSLISVVGFKLAGKAPDSKHPFGYGRTEYLAGLAVAFLIGMVGVEFAKTSIDHILHPSAVLFSPVLLVILALSMLVKLWMGAFNRNLGNRIDSTVLRAAMQDSINDVITTSVVIIGMIASQFTSIPADGYIGLIVAVFILWSGIGIARDTLSPLIGQAADPDIVQSIEDIVLSFDGIIGVHDLIVHNYGAGKSLASIHVEVPDSANFVAIHEVVDEAEKAVWQQTGVFLVIHMDPVSVDDEHIQQLRDMTLSAIVKIDNRLTMHDFRVVDGDRQINLIFDIVAPFEYQGEKQQQLLKEIRRALRARDRRFHAVITVDHQM